MAVGNGFGGDRIMPAFEGDGFSEAPALREHTDDRLCASWRDAEEFYPAIENDEDILGAITLDENGLAALVLAGAGLLQD
jgi:hypothetical protein